RSMPSPQKRSSPSFASWPASAISRSSSSPTICWQSLHYATVLRFCATAKSSRADQQRVSSPPRSTVILDSSSARCRTLSSHRSSDFDAPSCHTIKPMPSLSKAAANIIQSDIRTMSVECEKVRGINLAQGICDTEVPLPVRRRAVEAIEDGQNSYTRLDGIATLRAAIARKMRDYNSVVCDPEREVVVTAGSTGAFYSACHALLDPGDEVIVFEPYYGYHVNTLASLRITPAYVTLR